MVTLLHSKRSRLPDPDELRRIISLGKERGLIRDAGVATPIEKNGADAVHLGGVRSQWMSVTPYRATEWLANNFVNRPVSEDVIVDFARQMVNGEWIETHQGIAFNDKDELIDGQHRLLAIVRSGVTIRMMVTFGLLSKIAGKEMTTMDAVDRGRPRSVADQLKIQHGLKAGSAIAAVCKSVAAICSQERTRRLSVGQTLEIFRGFESAVLWVIEHRSKEPGLRQMGMLAGFAFAIATDEDAAGKKLGPTESTKICAMFHSVVSGDEIKARSPLAQLRAFLTSDEAKLLSQRTDRGLAELVLQGIYLELNRKAGRNGHAIMPKLELSQDGADFFRAMQPERVEKVAAMFRLPGHQAKASFSRKATAQQVKRAA